MDIKKYKDFILEKSIGSEEIRVKYYGDLEKRKYYEIINIDPTSVRKKDFSRPGKYSKWLLYQYKIGFLSDDNLSDSEYVNLLNYLLFVFSSNWYSNKVKKETLYLGGEIHKTIENDINKFSLSNFIGKLSPLLNEYKTETEDSKYDIVYSDKNIDIFVPLNFTASRESAKNTDWCSKNHFGYSRWSKVAILFRIIPKNDSYDRLKFTYKYDGKWFIAGPKYPELMGESDPFERLDGVPNWLETKKDETLKNDSSPSTKIKFDNIEKTMLLLSDEAIECIKKYYDLNKK